MHCQKCETQLDEYHAWCGPCLEGVVAEIAKERDVARHLVREARALILRGLEFSQTWQMRDRMCAWLKAQEVQ